MINVINSTFFKTISEGINPMKAFTTMLAITVVATIAGCIAPQQQGVSQTLTPGTPTVSSIAGQSLAIGTVTGQTPMVGQAPNLVDMLVQQMGVTPQQATGGAGAIFSTAKQGMSQTAFSQVAQAVPGMNQYLAAAPSQISPASGTANLLGMAGNALGGSGSTLGNMASLAGSFQSLGLNSGMVNQFIPIILQYVQTQGGSSTMGLLQGALVGR
jgi:Protein of unknown function VcgC/VcgE (DUF2780)